MKRLVTAVLATLLLTLGGMTVAATKTVTLSVPGMTCAVCPITVKKALDRVPGVSHIEVSHERKEAVVMFDDAKTSIQELIEATTNAGYPASVISK